MKYSQREDKTPRIQEFANGRSDVCNWFNPGQSVHISRTGYCGQQIFCNGSVNRKIRLRVGSQIVTRHQSCHSTFHPTQATSRHVVYVPTPRGKRCNLCTIGHCILRKAYKENWNDAASHKQKPIVYTNLGNSRYSNVTFITWIC